MLTALALVERFWLAFLLCGLVLLDRYERRFSLVLPTAGSMASP
jgi:hypothetical protein